MHETYKINIADLDRDLLKDCPRCEGKGELETGSHDSETGYADTRTCPKCEGECLVPDLDKLCESCLKREATKWTARDGMLCNECADDRDDVQEND